MFREIGEKKIFLERLPKIKCDIRYKNSVQKFFFPNLQFDV